MTETHGSNEPASQERSGAGATRGLALTIAILLSLAAAGAAGWLLWERQQDPLADAVTGLRVGLGSELESAAAERTALERRLDELAEDVAELRQARERDRSRPDPAERMASRVEALADDLNALEARLESRLESELAALESRLEERMDRQLAEAGRDSGSAREASAQRADARRLALQRAAALLARGQDELELAGDAELARRAWERAAEHLEALDDPRTGSIQRRVREELEAIRSWQPPQWHRQVARLHGLAAAVNGWPLRAPEPARTAPEADPDESPGWSQRLANTFTGLVRVRRREDAGPGPAEADDIRTALQAVLASAALAAARRDGALVMELVDDARSRLEAAFDTGHPAVAAALEELDSVAGLPEDAAPPAVGDARLAINELLDSGS